MWKLFFLFVIQLLFLKTLAFSSPSKENSLRSNNNHNNLNYIDKFVGTDKAIETKQGMLSFLNNHANAIGALGSLLGLGYWSLDTQYVRKWRLHFKFKNSLQPFNLKRLPYVPQRRLIEDIKEEVKGVIKCDKAGVRILWGVPGSGKTTTTKAVMNELIEENSIRGCVYVTPNENMDVGHAENFRRHLADWRGPILLPHEKLSTLLGNSPLNQDNKPYVIIFDQMDDPIPFDHNLKHFIKTLAYDSDSCKSYIVIFITTDYVRAMDAYEWNGGTKIAFLGQSKPWDYRWSKEEISTWLRQYRANHSGDKEIRALLEEGTDSYNQFMDVSLNAGTPGFLVNGIDKLKASNYPILEADSDKISTLWELGTKKLSQFITKDTPPTSKKR